MFLQLPDIGRTVGWYETYYWLVRGLLLAVPGLTIGWSEAYYWLVAFLALKRGLHEIAAQHPQLQDLGGHPRYVIGGGLLQVGSKRPKTHIASVETRNRFDR